jgi:hypothetical protein
VLHGVNAAAGVTEFDAAEAIELPTAFVATITKVYGVPFVNPVTLMGEVAPVAVMPPGLDVTVYPVITLPPSFVGAVNATLAERSPAVATTPVGAPGTVDAGDVLKVNSVPYDVPDALVA